MQGFLIGGSRIRLSWGRSQGDKAAAAAVTAAQRAAQLGHLAGLAGLSSLSQSQLAQLAGLSKAINTQASRSSDSDFSSQDLNSTLLRQLTAAASSLSGEIGPAHQSSRLNSNFHGASDYMSHYGGGQSTQGGVNREGLDSDMDLRAAFEGMGFNSGSRSAQLPQTERFDSEDRFGERGRSQSNGYPQLEQPRRNSPYTLVQSSKFAPFSPQDSPIGQPSNLPEEQRWHQH